VLQRTTTTHRPPKPFRSTGATGVGLVLPRTLLLGTVRRAGFDDTRIISHLGPGPSPDPPWRRVSDGCPERLVAEVSLRMPPKSRV
jgi:hypothetical protein